MQHTRSLGGFTILALVLAATPPTHADTIEGVWSTPVRAGNIADAVTGALSFQNNTGSAVSSISNGVAGSSISWGSWNASGITNPPGVLDIAGCAALAAGFGLPCQSTITFAGNAIPANPLVPFSLGTLTYTNGTSDLDSLIFGATLTFVDAQTHATLGSDFVQFVTTNNTGNTAQNADYITFSGLSGVSFNVIEGATAQASANGIIDDVVLTSLTLLSAPDTGFIGNSPSVPLTAPEPASIALLGLGLVSLGVARRRRRR